MPWISKNGTTIFYKTEIPPTNAHLLALEQQSAVKERRSATKVAKYRSGPLLNSKTNNKTYIHTDIYYLMRMRYLIHIDDYYL